MVTAGLQLFPSSQKYLERPYSNIITIYFCCVGLFTVLNIYARPFAIKHVIAKANVIFKPLLYIFQTAERQKIFNESVKANGGLANSIRYLKLPNNRSHLIAQTIVLEINPRKKGSHDVFFDDIPDFASSTFSPFLTSARVIALRQLFVTTTNMTFFYT